MGKQSNILIDTNILIYMYENKRDVFEDCKILIPEPKFYVLDKVYNELSKVLKDKPTKYLLIKKYLEKLKNAGKFEILNVDKEILSLSPKYEKVDNLLIYYSDKYLIYTNDKKLKEKIKLRRNKVLVLKSNGVLLT